MSIKINDLLAQSQSESDRNPMNEAETRAELIDPALKAAGWGVVDGSQIRREYPITQGRLQGGGQRAKAEIADYVLVYRNTKLAVRYTFATNGQAIYRIDMATGAEGDVPAFPSPGELWSLTHAAANVWRDRFAAVPFEDKGGAWQGRYYQDIAIRSEEHTV